MNSLNRQVAVVKPKEPYVDWVNSLPGMDEPVTIEFLNNDCTALLIPVYDNDIGSLKFIKRVYKEIFEIELNSWVTDKKYWPHKRPYALFREWFKIEIHSEVYDFGKGLVEVDEY